MAALTEEDASDGVEAKGCGAHSDVIGYARWNNTVKLKSFCPFIFTKTAFWAAQKNKTKPYFLLNGIDSAQ